MGGDDNPRMSGVKKKKQISDLSEDEDDYAEDSSDSVSSDEES